MKEITTVKRFQLVRRKRKRKIDVYPSDKEEHNKQPKEHDYNDKDSNCNGNKKNR
jgi:hypothetical protein